MKSFAAVLLIASAASAASVPVYQTPSVVVPSGNVVPGYSDVVRTEPVSTTYFRSGVVSHNAAVPVGAPVASVAYPAQTYPYGTHAQPVAYAAHAQPVAYAAHAQPVAYAAHAQPVAYAAHAQPVAYAADYVHPAGYGYVANPAYVAAPAVRV